MKKKVVFVKLFFLSVALFAFFGCSKSKEIEPYQNHNTPVKEFFLSITEYAVTGASSVAFPKKYLEKYYVSKNAVRFMSLHFFDRGRLFTVAEIYWPYNKGCLELYGYYDPSSDTGNWIEDCLIAYEEGRFAAVFEEDFEIDSPLAGMDDDFDFLTDYVEADGYVDLSEEVVVESGFSGSESGGASNKSVEKRLLDSNSRLRMLMFEDEIFIPETKAGEQVLISSDGKKVRRSFYDDKHRLEKREHWSITDLRNSRVTKSEEYRYSSKSFSPVEKAVTTDDTTIKTYFNLDGTAYKSETYKFASPVKDEKNVSDKNASNGSGNSSGKSDGGKTEGKKSEAKIRYLHSSIEWKYNKSGKITSEETVGYEYKNDNYETPSKIHRKKQLYAYHKDGEIPPNYQYFEDGNLRMRTIYTSKDEYRTDTLFDSNYIISTFYKDSKKVQEIYYQNGRAIRKRNYE